MAHLTLKERYVIEDALNDGKSFKQIGKIIFKDCTTISKEIRRNSTLSKPSNFNGNPNNCKNKKDCIHINLCNNNCSSACRFCNKCNIICSDYEPDICERLEKPPYVCNGCDNRKGCRKQKFIYRAKEADDTYRDLLKSSREGVNLDKQELEKLKQVIIPAIKNGHSPAMIIMNNPTIGRSESTIYRDIDKGVYDGIGNCNLPRKVKFKKRVSQIESTPQDTKNRLGRTWNDLQQYRTEHPNAKLVQFDTVEGVKGGKCLFTIHFPTISYMIAFLIDAQRSSIIVTKVSILKNVWGTKFLIDFEIVTPDNGKEFQDPDNIEFFDEEHKIHLFYCDPGKSYQKAEIENNHTFIRRILPKGTSFDDLTQEDINLMMNHINSVPREELNGNTPYELACLLIGRDIVDQFSKPIPRNEVILKPELLKKK